MPTSGVQHGAADMLGLVVLSNTWRDLSVDAVRQHLDALHPGQFLPPRDEGSFVIAGAVPGAQFMIQCAVPEEMGVYMLHNVPGPYSEFSPFADHIRDAALRAVALAQRCWLGVDRVVDYGKGEAEAYRFIGRLLARLAPPDSAVLVHPQRFTAVRFTDDIRRQLAQGERVFGQA
jgi:hypothetical protein